MLNGTGVKIFTGSSLNFGFGFLLLQSDLIGTSHPELAEIIARR
jgi:hypothetical protein